MSEKLRVKLTKSTIGCNAQQKATVNGLGLKKIRTIKELEDTPAIRGMIKKVNHLVDFEEI